MSHKIITFEGIISRPPTDWHVETTAEKDVCMNPKEISANGYHAYALVLMKRHTECRKGKHHIKSDMMTL